MTVETFEFGGFSIPVELIDRTGGGKDTFAEISTTHIAKLQRYVGIAAGANVVEIGCGIGRDAIPLIELIGQRGSYLGTDVIGESVAWCIKAITPEHPNFRFVHHDIHDTLHNPSGKLAARDIRLPVAAAWADVIILQSVFTHMFPGEIVHYLGEFARILKPSGRIWASVFLVNDAVLARARSNGTAPGALSFMHALEPGVFINHLPEPRGAVAFDEALFNRFVDGAGFEYAVPPIHGVWSGHWADYDFGQDAVVLQKARRDAPKRGTPRWFAKAG